MLGFFSKVLKKLEEMYKHDSYTVTNFKEKSWCNCKGKVVGYSDISVKYLKIAAFIWKPNSFES